MKLDKLSVTTACALVISGCGGGGGSSDSGGGPTINTGVFLDSAVEGLAYSTETQEGSTNAAGEFSYIEGEQVTFKIGAISLPAVSAQATITPLTVFGTTDVTDTGVSNLSRLLQSLDEDGDATNGISFADGLQSASAGTTLDFTGADFANNAAVINLVANSGSSTTALIDAAAAQAHLQSTLNTLISRGTTIETVEVFNTNIVGKNLILRDSGGNRDTASTGIVNSNMTTTGSNNSGSFELDWYWNNGAYCRSGVAGLPSNSVTIELDCQRVEFNQDYQIVFFTKDRGAGELASSWFIE